MLRWMLYLTGFLVLCGTCYADDKKESETDVARKNDEIIRTVHASGGLIFAVPPYWGRESTRISFEKLAKYLDNATHNEVVLIILKDYESLLKRTMAGQVDIGFYGPTLYVETKQACPGLRYIASSVWKTTGKTYYYSYLITRKGSGLSSLASLKGKSFAFGSKESTGGYMYPMAWMKDNNLDPKKYFKSVKFLGSHNNVLDAVASGKVDAGSVSPGPLENKMKEHGNVFNRIRKFGPIPSSVVALGNKMPDETIQRIIHVLLLLPRSVVDAEEMSYSGFRVLSDEAYDQFRRVIVITGSDGDR